MVRIMLLMLILFFASNCGEKIFTGDVNCSDCFTPKPDTVDLVIKFTLNGNYKRVPFVLYRGDFENNQVDWIDTADASPWYLAVKVGQKYSIRAKYEKGSKTLFAVDETKVKVLLVTDACDEDCYVIKNEKMDVQIRDKFLDF